MIVADTNLLAYLLIPGTFTARAERMFLEDPDWAAPRLWRSELRNVLSTYVRAKSMAITDAAALYGRAASIIGADEYEVDTLDVFTLSKQGGCSAYDCEFVALAGFLDVKLVTTDSKLVKAFPGRAMLLP